MGKLHSSGSPCPTNEWTLCLFATFLAGSVQHASIKVYLSAVRSRHIEEGFPDPLVNCLRLQRVIRGIKRTQGSSEAQRLLITNDILMIIFRSLDLSMPDHCMFWAACNLAYFGFLRSAEFTVPSLASFSSALHLSVQDISVDSDTDPSCLRVRIKASKTDPFRKGCFIHIGKGNYPLCALQSVLAYLAIRGGSGGPLFLFQDCRPLSCATLTSQISDILGHAGVPETGWHVIADLAADSPISSRSWQQICPYLCGLCGSDSGYPRTFADCADYGLCGLGSGDARTFADHEECAADMLVRLRTTWTIGQLCWHGGGVLDHAVKRLAHVVY
ncbi:hypothetical protein ACROYT_G015405 [Oculina patagonica]